MAETTKRQIGKYKIQAELGRGGFGVVYSAYDSTVGRPVAIKVLTAVGDDQLLTRFKNEAAAAGNLRHKNIVTIYDYGDDGGLPYIAMELLDGEDLNQVIGSKKPMPLLQKVSIMLQVADGLRCAHRAGVIHRDIKPGNIRLLPDGTVKLMDFGIARLLAGSEGTRLTRQGHIIGTLSYMSPEQVLGEEVDSLSDIFAYGSTYYELLTGKHPFQGSDPRSVFHKITSEDPEPIRNLIPDCPEALEKIVNRTLQKDRELRYQSLRDVQLDTEPILIDLQQERAQSLVAHAKQLHHSGDLESAQLVLGEISDLDPTNREARQLRETVQAQLLGRLIRPKVDALVKKADLALSTRNFEEAVESLGAALRLDRDSHEVSAKLEEARRLHAVSRESARRIADARRAFSKQNLESALEILPEILERDPGNPEAQRLLEEVRTELTRRERERQYLDIVQRVRALLQADNFAESSRLLEQLDPEFKGRKEVSDLAGQTIAAKELFERRQYVKQEIAASRELLANARFEAAIKRIEDLMNRFPEEVEPTKLFILAHRELAAHRKEQALEKLGEELDRLRESRHFEQALKLVGQSLQTYPSEQVLLDVQRDIEAEWAGFKKEAALRRVVEESEQYLAANELEKAIGLLEAAVPQYPDRPELVQRLASARDLLAAKLREEEIARLCSQAQSQMQQRHYPQALRFVDTGLTKFGADKRLIRLREDIAAAQLQWERSEAVRHVVEKSGELVGRNDFKAAFEVLEAAMQRFPDERQLLDSLAAARDALARHQREQGIDDLCRKVRVQQSNHEYQQALDAIGQGLAEYGSDVRLAELQEQVFATRVAWERSEAIREILARSQQLSGQGELTQAIDFLKSALLQFPDERRLMDALTAAIGALAVRERENAIEALRQEAQDQLRGNQFEAALETVRRGLAEYGSDRRLTGAQEQILVAKAVHERAEAVRQVIEDSQTLLGQRDFGRAIALLESALKRYPGQAEVAKALSATRDAAAASRRDQAIEAACVQSQDQTGKREFPRALKTIDRAQSDYGSDPRLEGMRGRILAAKADWEQTETVRGAIENSQKRFAQGKPGMALELLEAALKLYPTDQRLTGALASARAALDALRREETIGVLCQAAQSDLQARQFQRALDTLERGLREFVDDRRLSELRQKVSAAKAEWERTQALAQCVTEAQQRMAAQDPESAVELLNAGLVRFPGEPQLEEALARARQAIVRRQREQTIETALRSAQAWLGEHEFRRALEVLDAALVTVGTDPRLDDLRQQVVTARTKWEEEQAVRRILDEVQRQAGENKLQAALELLERGLTDYPGQPELLQALTEKRQKWEAAKREAAITELCQATRVFLATQDFPTALATVQRGIQAYGPDSRLAALRESLLSAQNEQLREQAVRSALNGSSELIRQGAPEKAVQLLEEASDRFPVEPLLVDALAAARKALALKKQEDRQQAIYTEATAHLERGNYDAALSQVDKGLEHDPRDSRLLVLRERVSAAKARWAEQQTADAVQAVVLSAKSLSERGQREEAVTLLEKALGEHPGNTELVTAIVQTIDAFGAASTAAIDDICRNARQYLLTGEVDLAFYTLEQALHPPAEKQQHSHEAATARSQASIAAAAGGLHSGHLPSGSTSVKEVTGDFAPLELQQEAPVPGSRDTIGFHEIPDAAEAADRMRSSGPEPRGPRRRLLLMGAVAALLLVAAIASVKILNGPTLVALTVRSSPAGATIQINGQTCSTPSCEFHLQPGQYRVQASTEGYESKVEVATLRPGHSESPLLISLKPLSPTMKVTSNFENGEISLDNQPAGRLEDGQFGMERLNPGLHQLRISGRDGTASLSFELADGRLPTWGDISRQNSEVIALGSYGKRAVVACSDCRGSVMLDDRNVGQLKDSQMSLSDIAPGMHKLKVGGREGSLVFSSGGAPSLQMAVNSTRNFGALLVETGEDGATVFVDGKRYPRQTSHGQLTIPAEAKQHTIRVAKDGYRVEPNEIQAQVAKGDQFQARFKLVVEPAVLTVSGQVAGAAVLIDNVKAGVVGKNGGFSAQVQPGNHAIEFSKEGYTPTRLQRSFSPGRTLSLRALEAPLVAKTANAGLAKGPVTSKPDPNAAEQEDWQKVAAGTQTVARVEDFLKSHPSGSHREEAQARLKELRQQQADLAREAAWNAVDKNSKAALQQFLSQHGDGERAQEARSMIAGLEKAETEQLAASQRAREQLTREAVDLKGISTTVSAFEAAYNRKDLASIQGLWSGMPKNILESYRNQFRDARELAFQLKLTGPAAIDGDAATATCTRTLRFVAKSGDRPPETNERVRVRLDRSGSQWVIRSVTPF